MDSSTVKHYAVLTRRYLFGCHHRHISRVFTISGRTYRVCIDCGSRFKYSLATMSMEGHEVPNPLYVICRAAANSMLKAVATQALRTWHSILHWGTPWAKGRA